jgi:hypothetical protein
MLTNNDETEVTATNQCTGTLAAGATCTVSATFRPDGGGARVGVLTIGASPGGAIPLDLVATGLFRLTVAVTGTGAVTSTPVGINCGRTCTGLFPAGETKLQATSTNGAGYRFAGWSVGGCAGIARTCTVNLSAATSITAAFAALTTNLVFLTSTSFPGNLGTAAAYDTRCNTAATAAGINDGTGTAYLAFLSSTVSLAMARLAWTVARSPTRKPRCFHRIRCSMRSCSTRTDRIRQPRMGS